MFVDGACRKNNNAKGIGIAAAAVIIYINNKRCGEFARAIGNRTNNESEYEAALLGIMLCWAANLKDPIVYSDSTLVVNQVLGKYECKNPSLKPYLFSIQQIEKEYRFRIQHVPRNKVSEADTLVNLYLDTMLKCIPPAKQEALYKMPPPPI